MGKIQKRRKPRLDEKRVEGIVSTFEAEVANADFEICGISLCCDDAGEWQVIVRPILPEGSSLDGGEKLVMVNDQTGKARYYAEYVRERDSRSRN